MRKVAPSTFDFVPLDTSRLGREPRSTLSGNSGRTSARGAADGRCRRFGGRTARTKAISIPPLGDCRGPGSPRISGARHVVLVDGPVRAGDALGPSQLSHRASFVDAMARTHPRARGHGVGKRRNPIRASGKELALAREPVRPFQETLEGDVSVGG